jgi:DNA-binding transcriptional regulator PaaX
VADGQIFTADHLGGDLPTLVAQAWDLPAIERRYEAFLAEFAPASAQDPLTRLIELVHAWRRSRRSTRACPPACCPAGGAAPRRRDCSPPGTRSGPPMQ